MGRKRQDRDPAPDLPPICRRIDWLLRQVWSNVIADMARNLGVSVTVVSRVLAGQQPSGQMLAGFARHGVNLRWLLTGQGQEMVGAGGDAGAAFWPVVTQLLPGRPVDNPELFGHFTLPAASPFLLESAYWLKLSADMPVASSPSSGLSDKDYLLIETAQRWAGRPEAYLGRMVVLRLPEGKGSILGKVERDPVVLEETPQHEIKTFGVFKEARLFPTLAREAAERGPLASNTGGAGLVGFYPDDVAGVVLQRVTFLDR